jgi:hypothetical protein
MRRARSAIIDTVAELFFFCVRAAKKSAKSKVGAAFFCAEPARCEQHDGNSFVRSGGNGPLGASPLRKTHTNILVRQEQKINGLSDGWRALQR